MNYKTLLLGVVVIALFVTGAYKHFAPKAEEAMQEKLDSFASEPRSLEVVAEEDVPISGDSAVLQEKKKETETSGVSSDEVAVPSEKTGSEIFKTPTTPKETAAAEVATELEPELAASGYTLAEVAVHADASSCWTAVGGKVYDLTSFIAKHPGGAENILRICGIDGTAAFEKQHGGDSKPENTLDGFYIGELI